MSSIINRLLLSPDGDGGGTPDGAENAGSPDGAENTGHGQSPQPSSADIDAERINKSHRAGMAKGVTKTLRELGFDTADLSEAREALEALRNPTPPQSSDDSEAKLREIRQAHAKLERELEARQAEIKALAARADVARRLAIQSAAVEAGVGAGKQAEAFVRIYGDRFDLGENDSLQAVITGSDGEPIAGVVDPSDLIAQMLEESPFLRAPSSAAGAGSGKRPTNGATSEDDEAKRRSQKLWGTGEKSEGSYLDRVLKRGT